MLPCNDIILIEPILQYQQQNICSAGAYRVWWSLGAGIGPCRWPCRSASTGDPTLLRGLVPATSSFLKDWRTGEPLSIGTPWGGRPWGGPPWMSIIRTSAIRWGDGGGVLEPRVGSWLFLDFCLYREGWSMESVGLGPPYELVERMEARWNPPSPCSGPSSPEFGCAPWELAMLSLPSWSKYVSAYKPSFPLARVRLLLLMSSSGLTSRRSRMALGQGELERAEGLAVDTLSRGTAELLGAEPCLGLKGILEGDGGMEFGAAGSVPWTEWCSAGLMGGCLRGWGLSRLACSISLCIWKRKKTTSKQRP